MRLTFEDGEREVLLARLGLETTADEAALAARLAAWVQEDPNQNNNSAQAGIVGETGTPPEDQGDFVVVDVASFARMRSTETVAAAVVEANRVRDRNELIEEAIADGKFGPARRNHYRDRYDSDPEGTTLLIGRLMPNTVPLEARGATEPTDETDDDSYPQSWVPEVQGRVDNSVVSTGSAQVPVRRSRVHSEQ